MYCMYTYQIVCSCDIARNFNSAGFALRRAEFQFCRPRTARDFAEPRVGAHPKGDRKEEGDHRGLRPRGHIIRAAGGGYASSHSACRQPLPAGRRGGPSRGWPRRPPRPRRAYSIAHRYFIPHINLIYRIYNIIYRIYNIIYHTGVVPAGRRAEQTVSYINIII